jgi:hypothetical protein
MSARSGQSGNWPKAIVKAKKASEKAGWTWTYGGSGHWTVRNPEGEWVLTLSSTFYDGPLTRKFLSKLRKAGCPGA